MNKYLTKKIWEMRKEISIVPGTLAVSLNHIAGNVYQLLFATCGCEYACSFCNYGFDFNLTLPMVKPELEKIHLENYIIDELEIEANGSFLSEREIPYDLFIEVLHFIAHKNIPSITFETHYRTITEEKIKTIRNILGNDQEVFFELGFESICKKSREIYNKDINIYDFISVAKMCEKYEIKLLINILLGVPFHTRNEQINDCLKSLDFVFSELPQDTYAILFPINIKEHTMLKYWQEKGLYDQISSWEFVELLHKIPEKYLSHINIAWWGSRKNIFHTENTIQHPRTCPKCSKRLQKFYNSFYINFDSIYRKQLIENIWNTRCDCDTH